MSLPLSWSTAALGEVVDILDSGRVPVNAYERANRLGDVPYYGATGQVGWIDDFLFNEELVLLGEDGAPFLDAAKPKAYLITGKSWVNNHAHVLRGKTGLLNRFLVHQLNVIDYHPFVSGSTRLKLPQAPLRQINLRIAPTQEQLRIVDEIEKQFTRLDDAVAALKRVQVNLKRYRASVLKAACEGRLVPTEAELARKEGRDYEPASELLKRILAERRAKWEADQLQKMIAAGKSPKDDEWKKNYKEPAMPDAGNLPQLPDGWSWASLDSLAQIVGGLTKGQKRKPGETLRSVPYLRVANVQRGMLDLSEIKTIEATPQEIEGLTLLPGDVLFNEGGDRDKLGRGWIWEGQILKCIHQNHVFRARMVGTQAQPKFISWYANSLGQQYFFDEGKQTTNLASLNMTKLKGLPVPLPPWTEQIRIVEELEKQLTDFSSLERAAQASAQRAQSLRQAVLRSAFLGKLTPQLSTDEPASVLLERIRAERATALATKNGNQKAATEAWLAHAHRRRRVKEQGRGFQPRLSEAKRSLQRLGKGSGNDRAP